MNPKVGGSEAQEATLSKAAMLKLLTVVALIVTLYVMEAQAGYKIEKNPKGYGSEY